jgi:hypothetical protein
MVVLSELFHRPQDSMADLSRSPTSSWTAHELIAYNIAIITQTPQEFFHQNAEPSLEHIHPALITVMPLPTSIRMSQLTFRNIFHIFSWLSKAVKKAFSLDSLGKLSTYLVLRKVMEY